MKWKLKCGMEGKENEKLLSHGIFNFDGGQTELKKKIKIYIEKRKTNAHIYESMNKRPCRAFQH